VDSIFCVLHKNLTGKSVFFASLRLCGKLPPEFISASQNGKLNKALTSFLIENKRQPTAVAKNQKGG
jgi:hypothetical protein